MSIEQLSDLEIIEQAPGRVRIDRRQCCDPVGQQLDHHPAGGNDDDRPEELVAHHPESKLDPARGHRLNDQFVTQKGQGLPCSDQARRLVDIRE